MPVETQAAPSKAALYTGFTLFMLMDAGVKFTHAAPVIAANNELGFPLALVPSIGILSLVLLALYLIPATSVLGAVLFTGYFGGAIALHLRIDHPLFSYTLFPIYVALFLWGGIWLRDASLRRLFPLTETPFTPPASRAQLLTGRALTSIGALMILASAVIKFTF